LTLFKARGQEMLNACGHPDDLSTLHHRTIVKIRFVL